MNPATGTGCVLPPPTSTSNVNVAAEPGFCRHCDVMQGLGAGGPGPATVTRGGSTVTRGGSTVTRGGSTVTRGGSTVTRGGSTVTRGGSTVTRGGSTVTRGGSTATRGGSTVTRGGSCSVARDGGDDTLEDRDLQQRQSSTTSFTGQLLSRLYLAALPLPFSNYCRL